MKLTPVTGPAFGTQCCACHKHVIGGDMAYQTRMQPGRVQDCDNVFADLDGVPFRSYYCEECAQQIRAGLPGPWDTTAEFFTKIQALHEKNYQYRLDEKSMELYGSPFDRIPDSHKIRVREEVQS